MSNTKFIILALVLLVLLGTAGALIYLGSQEDSQVKQAVDRGLTVLTGGKCGDGVCDQLEQRTGACPQDCAAEESALSGQGLDAINLGLMIHLEGWEEEQTNEDMFNIHAAAARSLADKLEEYGAVATFEAREEFVKASETWGDNVLLELYERGHGIGVHADVGGSLTENIDLARMTKRIRDMRILMEQVTGVDIRHASGICSHLDWAQALIDAGYDFTTGLVAYCVMAMDYEDRPDEFKDCTTPSKCHEVYPYEIEDRMTPWRISTAKNWLRHDPNGELVVIMEMGGIYAMNEEFGDGTGDNELTSEDVAVFIEQLDRAVAALDPAEVNTIYLSWSIGNAKRVESPVVDEWLQAVAEYVEAGTVEWRTIPEMYDLYTANE